METLLHVAREKEVRQFEESFESRHTGETHHFMRIISPVLDANDNVVKLLGFGLDITERKQADKILKVSEQRFRELFENSPDAIFVENLDGIVLDANPAAYRLHRAEHDLLVGRNVHLVKALNLSLIQNLHNW